MLLKWIYLFQKLIIIKILYLNNPTNPCQNIPLIYDCDVDNYKKEDEKECKENKIQEKDDMEARP